MPHRLEVILFDVGGVLVQLSSIPTLLSWLGNRLTADEVWRVWLTSPIVRRFETGQMPPQAFADQIIESMNLPVTQEAFLAAFVSWPIGLYPDVLTLVKSIPSRYMKATLFNTNELHWPKLMYEMGLASVIELHFASHLIGKIKPDRDAFEYVVTALGRPPSRFLFLDDNQLNVEAARSIGMRAVRVCGVEGAAEALREYEVI